MTDAQWAWIEPLLPERAPKRGGRWPDHREVIDVIAFKFQTGTQWVHLPEKYGNWRGTYNRLRMWAIDGTWEQVFTALMAQADAGEDINGVRGRRCGVGRVRRGRRCGVFPRVVCGRRRRVIRAGRARRTGRGRRLS